MMMMRLMVKCSQVAMGRRSQLSVYGSDWDTEDGTGECFVIVFALYLYLGQDGSGHKFVLYFHPFRYLHLYLYL